MQQLESSSLITTLPCRLHRFTSRIELINCICDFLIFLFALSSLRNALHVKNVIFTTREYRRHFADCIE